MKRKVLKRGFSRENKPREKSSLLYKYIWNFICVTELIWTKYVTKPLHEDTLCSCNGILPHLTNWVCADSWNNWWKEQHLLIWWRKSTGEKSLTCKYPHTWWWYLPTGILCFNFSHFSFFKLLKRQLCTTLSYKQVCLCFSTCIPWIYR